MAVIYAAGAVSRRGGTTCFIYRFLISAMFYVSIHNERALAKLAVFRGDDEKTFKGAYLK